MSGNLGLTGLAPGDTSEPGFSLRVPWTRLRAYWSAPAGITILAVTALALAIRIFTLTRSGYLTGVTEYDDGVYLGGSIRLLQGVLPYRDWAFVQPPGILLVMVPVALLTKVTTATHAMAAARILTVLASTACVPLIGSLVRHRGMLVTLVSCGILAVYPDDVTTAHTLILEPWMNLLLLTGACFAFRQGRLAGQRRLLWAGVAIGFAGAVKFWAALPALVLLAVCLAAPTDSLSRVRRSVWYAIGVAAGFGVPVLPFGLTAPVTFVRSTVLDQAARDGSYVPHSMRLAHITGLIDFLNGNGGFTLDAGTHSLFANGGAAATPGTSAGWVPYAVALFAAALVAAGYLTRGARLSPFESFALVTAVLATGAVMVYSAFFYHYPDFGAPWIAIGVGGAFAGFGVTRRSYRLIFGCVELVVVLLAVFQASEVAGLGAPDIYHDQAVIPAGACVVTDQVSMTLAANRFVDSPPGCPVVMDGLGETLVLSNGVSVQAGADSLPHVVAAWQSILGKADYVWLSPNNARRIPWTPGLVSWFDANFTELNAYGGMGTVYKRTGS